MTGPIERPWWRGGGWGLAFGSFGLAVAAVAVLALGADDTRLLRLGIVAALWAALLGAFAAARLRREARSTADRADELRTVYQLELEREVTARREHELTVERELREQYEERQQAEMAALRAELHSLQGTLRHLLGGDVLVERERVALRESTRLRPLSDHSRGLPAADALSGAPRRFAISDWPVSEVEAESLPSARHIPYPVDQPAERGVGDRPGGPLDPIRGPWNGNGGGRSSTQSHGAQSHGAQSHGAQTDRMTGPAEPLRLRRAESERARDPGPSDQTWSPAVSWSPSTSSGSVPPDTGMGVIDPARRRYLAEPDLAAPGPGGAGTGRPSAALHTAGGTDPLTNRDPLGQPPAGNGRHGWLNEPSWSPSTAESPMSWETPASNGGTAPREPGANSAESRAPDQSVGAHRGGRSVQDLLAAYGESSAPRHRRRRKDS